MRYYGSKKEEIIEHRLCEYIRCDKCGKKLDKYYSVMTGHRDWGNDSVDSIRNFDLCSKCINIFVKDYLQESSSNTSYINIDKEIFSPKKCGEYDELDDNLVEEDLGGENE